MVSYILFSIGPGIEQIFLGCGPESKKSKIHFLEFWLDRLCTKDARIFSPGVSLLWPRFWQLRFSLVGDSSRQFRIFLKAFKAFIGKQ